MVRARNAWLGQTECCSERVGVLALRKVSSEEPLLGKGLPLSPSSRRVLPRGDAMLDAFAP